MLAGYLFWLSFIGATLYVLFVGTKETLYSILVMIGGVVATTLVFVFGSNKWLHLDKSVLAIDILALVLFVAIALRSPRWWPLLLCGWQLAAVAIHLATLYASQLLPRAYGIGQGFWAYLEFGTILIVTIIDRKRTTRG
jgi:hypothetical protein